MKMKRGVLSRFPHHTRTLPGCDPRIISREVAGAKLVNDREPQVDDSVWVRREKGSDESETVTTVKAALPGFVTLASSANNLAIKEKMRHPDNYHDRMNQLSAELMRLMEGIHQFDVIPDRQICVLLMGD